jgi:hypothetical protein
MRIFPYHELRFPPRWRWIDKLTKISNKAREESGTTKTSCRVERRIDLYAWQVVHLSE